MKQYLLFAGSNFYPVGGWSDFQGGFDGLDDALRHLNAQRHDVGTVRFDWAHVADASTGIVVWEGRPLRGYGYYNPPPLTLFAWEGVVGWNSEVR